MKKTKNDCLFSYDVKYKKHTEKQMKELEKQIYNLLIQDTDFNSKIVTESNYRITNRIKVKKTLKILVLNVIRAINFKKPLVISFDNNILVKKGIYRNIYKGIITTLNKIGLINIIKGNYKGKIRTRLEATEQLKNMIIRYTVEYTEEIKARYVDTKEYPNSEKIKITFESEDKNQYSRFFLIDQSDFIFNRLLENENAVFKLKINNRKQIVDIR